MMIDLVLPFFLNLFIFLKIFLFPGLDGQPFPTTPSTDGIVLDN